MGNNYYNIVDAILTTAKKHKLINDTYYGDIYEFHNSGNRKYSTFVLTSVNTVEGDDITTYSFNAFVTDRLTDDKSNLIEVQSLSKTILSQILKECFENIGDITYTFWTEKFNDLCAGCYASFSVSIPNEFTCTDKNIWRGTKIPYAIIPISTDGNVTLIKAIKNDLFPDGSWNLRYTTLFIKQTEYDSSEWLFIQGQTTTEYIPFTKENYNTFINNLTQNCPDCLNKFKTLYK